MKKWDALRETVRKKLEQYRRESYMVPASDVDEDDRLKEDLTENIMKVLEEKFRTIKNGKGIAYTVPMTGTIGVAIYQFLSNNSK